MDDVSRRVPRVDPWSVVIVVLTASIGSVLRSRLPPTVAIHFSAAGTPGNYVPRAVAVFGMPLVMVLTLAVLRGAARIDPPEDPRAFDVVVRSTMLLLAVVQGFTLGWSLRYRIPFAVVPAVVVLWSVLVVGYSLRAEGSR
jgi:uncharacterized membrane protein